MEAVLAVVVARAVAALIPQMPQTIRQTLIHHNVSQAKENLIWVLIT